MMEVEHLTMIFDSEIQVLDDLKEPWECQQALVRGRDKKLTWCLWYLRKRVTSYSSWEIDFLHAQGKVLLLGWCSTLETY